MCIRDRSKGSSNPHNLVKATILALGEMRDARMVAQNRGVSTVSYTHLEGVPYEVAKEALRLAAQKLPVTTKFIVRRDYDAQNQNA